MCFVFSSSHAPAVAAELVLETVSMRACVRSIVTDMGTEACSTVGKDT